MGRSVVFAAFMFGILLVATPSRSDVSPTPSPVAAPEPITGTPATSAAGSEPAPRDPFTPYGVGPAAAAWKYSDLTPAERAAADRGGDTTGWDNVHAAYNSAIAEQAQRAIAGAAQNRLGIDNLAGIGVVP